MKSNLEISPAPVPDPVPSSVAKPKTEGSKKWIIIGVVVTIVIIGAVAAFLALTVQSKDGKGGKTDNEEQVEPSNPFVGVWANGISTILLFNDGWYTLYNGFSEVGRYSVNGNDIEFLSGVGSTDIMTYDDSTELLDGFWKSDSRIEQYPSHESPDAADMVYSNSCDGFTNIRSYPSAGSPVVGKFFNGPKGATILERNTNWVKVSFNGVEGYAYAPITSWVPTPEVTVDISSGWLYGEWIPSTPDPLVTYTFYENGTFSYSNYIGVGYDFTGKWYLDGSDIVLVEKWNNGEFDLRTYKMHLDGTNRTIEGYKQGHLDTSDLGA